MASVAPFSRLSSTPDNTGNSQGSSISRQEIALSSKKLWAGRRQAVKNNRSFLFYFGDWSDGFA